MYSMMLVLKSLYKLIRPPVELSTKWSVQPQREPKLMNPESWPFAKKCMYGDVLLYWLDHLSDSTCIDRHEIDNLSCGRFLFSFSTHRQSLKSYTIKHVSAWVLNIKFGSMEPFTNHKHQHKCSPTQRKANLKILACGSKELYTLPQLFSSHWWQDNTKLM